MTEWTLLSVFAAVAVVGYVVGLWLLRIGNRVDRRSETVFTTDVTPTTKKCAGCDEQIPASVPAVCESCDLHRLTNSHPTLNGYDDPKDQRAHATHINHLPHLGKWQPYCDLCGTIGRGEDYEADAVAIADRHAEIGGFG